MRHCDNDVRFSNRPFGVKHFQTIHRCSVDVAHGLVLLSGISTKAFRSWDSKTRWSNLMSGLAVKLRQVQAEVRTHLIHRDGLAGMSRGRAMMCARRAIMSVVECDVPRHSALGKDLLER